jgi:hypothetical protein
MDGASSKPVTEQPAPYLNAKPAIAIVATETLPAAKTSAKVINIADRRYLPRRAGQALLQPRFRRLVVRPERLLNRPHDDETHPAAAPEMN